MDTPRLRLLRNNPFSSGVASNPWDEQAPDVPSLNQEVYEGLLQLVFRKGARPEESLGGLVLGEPGTGKTHLLKRLLHGCRERGAPVAFVFVKPLLAPERRMRHMLQEIMVNLTRQYDGRASQLDGFIARFFREYYGHLFENGQAKIEDKAGVRYFVSKFPDLYDDFLRVLFATRYPQKRDLATSWLQGRIDEDHIRVLGVRNNRQEMSEKTLENEAREIVLSLGLLMEHFRMVVPVCFDQLDSLRDEEVLDGFAEIVNLLCNDTRSMLPMAFVRSITWHDRFSRLDPATRQRFEMNAYQLKGCTLAQAHQLLRSRLDLFFGEEESGALNDWLLQAVQGKLREGYAPRNVIKIANQAILAASLPLGAEKTPAPASEEPMRFLGFEYRQECDRIAADFDAWPPDCDRLLLALETYLKSCPDYVSVDESTEEKDRRAKYLILFAERRTGEGRTPCAYILNTAEHFKTVQAAFERGIRFLQENPGGECVYVTDGRCTFRDETRWKEVHRAGQQFAGLGGKQLFLDRSRAVEWYALTSLIFKVEAGDVSLLVAGVPSPANTAQLAQFLRETFPRKLLEGATSAPRPFSPPAS